MTQLQLPRLNAVSVRPAKSAAVLRSAVVRLGAALANAAFGDRFCHFPHEQRSIEAVFKRLRWRAPHTQPAHIVAALTTVRADTIS